MDTYARRNGAGSPYNLGNRYGGSTSPKDWTKPPSSLPEAFENRNIRKMPNGTMSGMGILGANQSSGAYMITARGNGDILSALAKPTQMAAARAKEIAFSAAMNGAGEAREGLRVTREYTDVTRLTIGSCTAVISMPFTIAAKHENAEIFKGRSIMVGGRARACSNMSEYIESVNGSMQKMGLSTRYSENMSGSKLVGQVRRDRRAVMKAIRKSGIKLSPEEMKNLKKMFNDLEKVGKNSNIVRGRLRMTSKRLLSSALRQLQKNDCWATQGIAATIKYLRLGRTTAKMGVKITRKAAVLAKIALRKATMLGLLAAKKMAVKSLVSKRESVRKAAKAGQKATDKTSKIISRRRQRKKERKEARKRLKNMFNLKLRIKNSKAYKALADSPLGRMFGWISGKLNFIGQIAKLPGQAIKLILKVIAAIITVIIILNLVISLITSGVTSAIAGLSFNAVDTDIREKLTDELNTLYTDDLKYIAELPDTNPDIRSVDSITYDDIKDGEDYDDQYQNFAGKGQKKEADYRFQQSTNCAELLSMTLARFDYDISNASYTNSSGTKYGTDAAIAYLDDMYNGSHTIEVKRVQHEDKKGDTYYTAEVTYKTVYFSGLFDVQGCSDRQVNFISDYNADGVTIDEGGDIKTNMYYIMRYKGLTHEQACGVLGNVKAECDFHPDLSQKGLIGPKQGYGLFQWTEGRKSALKKFCQSNSYDPSSVSGQMEYFFHELGSSESKAGSSLKGAKTVDDAAWVFNRDFERSKSSQGGKGSSGSQKRIAFARQIAKEFAKYKDNWKSLYNETASGQGIVNGIIQVPYINQGSSGGLYDFKTKKYTHNEWVHYRFKCNGHTITQAGCGQCATAMAVSYCTGKMIAPSSFAKWYTGNGTSSDVGVGGAAKYGVSASQTTDFNKVVSALKRGCPVMSLQGRGKFTRGGHYILLVGCKGGKIAVNDSGGQARTTRVSGKWFSQKDVTCSAKGAYTIFTPKSSVSGQNTNAVSGNGKIAAAVRWAVSIAEDNRNGYSKKHRMQKNRLGGTEYDCSSFVGTAFNKAGVKVTTGGTSTSVKSYRAHGFKIMNKSQVKMSDLKAGDVLWRNHHIELCIGNGKTVGAHDDYDKRPGDSMGKDISVVNVRYHYNNATKVFRPKFS